MIEDAQMMAPDEGMPQEPQQPDGGDPNVAIGFIPDEYSAKEKTFLTAAKAVLLNDQTAGIIRQMLGQGGDATKTLALLLAQTVDKLETKLGPLNDDEHDRVCLVLAGWMASTMQAMGMPGMDDPGGRQDFMGRVLTQLDSMTQGGGEQGEQPAPEQPPEQAPIRPFAGGA